MTHYFDHTATGIVDPELVDFYAQALKDYPYNPAANYKEARRGRQAIEQASKEIAQLLDCQPTEVIYTSSGTESINTAIKSVGYQTQVKGGKIVVPEGEHPATSETISFLADKLQREINYIPLKNAQPDLELLEEALASYKTDLLSAMLVSNLTGAIYPVHELRDLLRKYAPQARFHLDAVQALGKLELSFRELACDYLSFSLHKVGAPKGLGLLLARKNLPLEPLLLGGGQQSGKRSSTENPAQALTTAFAVKKVLAARAEETSFTQRLHQAFLSKLDQLELDYRKLSPQPAVPHIIALYVPGLRAQSMQTVLAQQGYLVGIGSACSSAKAEVVGQVKALGLVGEDGYHLLRISLNSMNCLKEVERLAVAIKQADEKYGI